MVDIKTQELTTFVFILPVSVCHSFFPPPPPSSFFHCALQSGIVHKCAPQELVIGLYTMPANPEGHLRIMHQRKGRGWNRGFVVKACLSMFEICIILKGVVPFLLKFSCCLEKG